MSLLKLFSEVGAALFGIYRHNCPIYLLSLDTLESMTQFFYRYTCVQHYGVNKQRRSRINDAIYIILSHNEGNSSFMSKFNEMDVSRGTEFQFQLYLLNLQRVEIIGRFVKLCLNMARMISTF